MKIAILSGKGGTGKTFVAISLAYVLENAIYIDCDVEEPNGRLFFKPTQLQRFKVNTFLPVFDNLLCNSCRKCVDFCRFNAIVFLDKPKVFAEVCHSCGGCKIVCPQNAVSLIERTIGHLEIGNSKNTKVVTGEINIGEASGVPVIKAALRAGSGDIGNEQHIIIDCPPGSGCGAIECVSQSDVCIFVVEPTSFGLENFKMVYQLATLLNKPFAVIINKESVEYPPLMDFCLQNNVKIICRIPYSETLAKLNSNAHIACEKDKKVKKLFVELKNAIIKGEAT